MLVSDLRHFLDLPDHTPAPALRLGGQLRDIVRAATAREEGEGWLSALRCRRRPGNRSCPGRLGLRRTDERALISWQCTACHDEGHISGWQDTPCDLRGRAVESDGPAKEIVVSDDVVASLREALLLDADCERVAYGARTVDGQIVLTATQEQLDELLGYLAAEANHETNPRRRKRVNTAYDQLSDTVRTACGLTTAPRDESGRRISRPVVGFTPTRPPGGMPDLDVARVQRWCAARVPEHARHQVQVECEIGERHLTIVERRAPWRDDAGPDWTNLPVARLRYAKTAKTWTPYWRDRNHRFHRYDRLPPSAHVEDLLLEIDRDPTGVFWD